MANFEFSGEASVDSPSNDESSCDSPYEYESMQDVALDFVLDFFHQECERCTTEACRTERCHILQDVGVEFVESFASWMWKEEEEFRQIVVSDILERAMENSEMQSVLQTLVKEVMQEELLYEGDDAGDLMFTEGMCGYFETLQSDGRMKQYNDEGIYYQNLNDLEPQGTLFRDDENVVDEYSFSPSYTMVSYALVALVLVLSFRWTRRVQKRHTKKSSFRAGAGLKKLQAKRRNDMKRQVQSHDGTKSTRSVSNKSKRRQELESTPKSSKKTRGKGRGKGKKNQRERNKSEKQPGANEPAVVERVLEPWAVSPTTVEGESFVKHPKVDEPLTVEQRVLELPRAVSLSTEGESSAMEPELVAASGENASSDEVDRNESLALKPMADTLKLNDVSMFCATKKTSSGDKHCVTTEQRPVATEQRPVLHKIASTSTPEASKQEASYPASKEAGQMESPRSQVHSLTPKWSEVVSKSMMDTKTRTVTPPLSDSPLDELQAFLVNQKECIKGSPESFCEWLASEDVFSMDDLVDAVSDEDFIMMLQQGNGTVGIKGYRRTAFKKAVLAATGSDNGANENDSNSDTRTNNDDFPAELVCPISHVLMTEDPVVAADGYTYERAAIGEWIQKQQTEIAAAKQQGDSKQARSIIDRGVLSPMTHMKLSHLKLIPNHSVRTMARDVAENIF